MTQAIDFIKGALRVIGVTDSYTQPDAQQSADALSSLNNMLYDWSTQPLMSYDAGQENYAVVSSITSLTIGPTGTKATARPTGMNNLFIRVSSVDYPITLISSGEYDAISVKTITGGYPQFAFYDPAMTNGVLYLWPNATSGQTLYWEPLNPLQTFALTTTASTLPPNYNRAIIYNLGVELAPEYGVDVKNAVSRIAALSKRSIKMANAKAPHMSVEASALASGGIARANILIGQ